MKRTRRRSMSRQCRLALARRRSAQKARRRLTSFHKCCHTRAVVLSCCARSVSRTTCSWRRSSLKTKSVSDHKKKSTRHVNCEAFSDVSRKNLKITRSYIPFRVSFVVLIAFSTTNMTKAFSFVFRKSAPKLTTCAALRWQLVV